MRNRRTIINILMTAAIAIAMIIAAPATTQTAFAQGVAGQTAGQDWNVKSIQFIPASESIKMSKILERDNDGIYALNLTLRGKRGMKDCFFMNGDKCTVTYNDNTTKEFTFSRIIGVSYAAFKAADNTEINLEALETDNAHELKQSGEVSVDELAAIIGNNGVTIEYGEYWDEGDEVVGHRVLTHAEIKVTDDKGHDHRTALRSRNQTPAQCEATGMKRDCEYCQVCGKYFADTEATQELNKADLIIDMLGHDWGGWTPVATDPTKEERSCSRCMEKETRVAPPPAGHTHTPGTDLHWRDPKCLVHGIAPHYICEGAEGCGAMLVKNGEGVYVEADEGSLRIPAEPHKKGAPAQGKVTPPTCVSRGGYNLTYRCEKCNAVVSVERVVLPIDPNAHRWAEWNVTKNASLAEEGSQTRACALCGATETQSMPKLVLQTPDVRKLGAGKRSFTLKWGKVAGVSGYQIRYARNSKFTKGKRTIRVKKASTVSRKIRKLRGKRNYYVRIRSYKKTGGRTYYSAWSDVMKIKTKR